MTKYIDADRLRAEIERLKKICTAQIKANPGQTFPFVMEMTGYDKLLSFLSTLESEKLMNQKGLDVTDFCKPIDPGIAQCIADHSWEMLGEDEKPVPADLEEAAKAMYPPGINDNLRFAFITGAKWDREQMMSKAVETEVTETCGVSSVWIKTKQFKPGQKVRVITCKKED